MTGALIVASEADFGFASEVRAQSPGLTVEIRPALPGNEQRVVLLVWSAAMPPQAIDVLQLIELWSRGRLLIARRDDTALPLGMGDLDVLSPELSANEVARKIELATLVPYDAAGTDPPLPMAPSRTPSLTRRSLPIAAVVALTLVAVVGGILSVLPNPTSKYSGVLVDGGMASSRMTEPNRNGYSFQRLPSGMIRVWRYGQPVMKANESQAQNAFGFEPGIQDEGPENPFAAILGQVLEKIAEGVTEKVTEAGEGGASGKAGAQTGLQQAAEEEEEEAEVPSAGPVSPGNAAPPQPGRSAKASPSIEAGPRSTPPAERAPRPASVRVPGNDLWILSISIGLIGLLLAAGAALLSWRRKAVVSSPSPVVEPTAPMDEMLFVSYARGDLTRVDQVVSEIEMMGRAVWIDRRGVIGGPGWAGQITRAVKSSRALVLMASPSAYASHQVVRELYLAMNAKKQIIPIEIEPAELPDELEYILAPYQRHVLEAGEPRTVLARALDRV
ncbi:MAG: toll/interleukin-1 receptor domain-containing protein [Alphaproteobacteria bacterium]|nr:toll/interleukin-1 receptor domain-containing protein [Alphaproteobacteria bacterium]